MYLTDRALGSHQDFTLMDDDFHEEELAAIQAALDGQQWELEEGELDYQALASMGAIAYGLEQARWRNRNAPEFRHLPGYQEGQF